MKTNNINLGITLKYTILYSM